MAVLSKNEVPPWGLAVAGTTGAVVANALVYPLDMIKTRLQTQVKQQSGNQGTSDSPHYSGTMDAVKSIFEDEGIEGLYSGMFSSLLSVASTNFAYFFWYSTVRELYFNKIQKSDKNPSTVTEFALGAAAGALAQLFTIPVAVVTTRQQTQSRSEKKNMLATGKEVVEGPDGVTGLWRGLKASLILVVNPAITYGAYQRLHQILFPTKAHLRPHEAFLLGALSKMLASVVTQPLIVAKVGLQSKPPPSRNGKPFKSFLEVMEHIREHEGLLGLYKGLLPQILKGFLVQGILMMIKERMEIVAILVFRYMRKVRQEKLDKLAKAATAKLQDAKNAVTS